VSLSETVKEAHKWVLILFFCLPTNMLKNAQGYYSIKDNKHSASNVNVFQTFISPIDDRIVTNLYKLQPKLCPNREPDGTVMSCCFYETTSYVYYSCGALEFSFFVHCYVFFTMGVVVVYIHR
jgi:hypothetical protein